MVFEDPMGYMGQVESVRKTKKGKKKFEDELERGRAGQKLAPQLVAGTQASVANAGAVASMNAGGSGQGISITDPTQMKSIATGTTPSSVPAVNTAPGVITPEPTAPMSREDMLRERQAAGDGSFARQPYQPAGPSRFGPGSLPTKEEMLEWRIRQDEIDNEPFLNTKWGKKLHHQDLLGMNREERQEYMEAEAEVTGVPIETVRQRLFGVVHYDEANAGADTDLGSSTTQIESAGSLEGTMNAQGQKYHKGTWVDANVYDQLYSQQAQAGGGDEFATQGGTGMAPPLAGHDTPGKKMEDLVTTTQAAIFQSPLFRESSTSWTPEFIQEKMAGIKEEYERPDAYGNKPYDSKKLQDAWAEHGSLTQFEQLQLDRAVNSVRHAARQGISGEEGDELAYSYLKEQGFSDDLIKKNKYFQDFTPQHESTLTPQHELNKGKIAPAVMSSVEAANKAISEGTQAMSVSDYGNISSTMQNALNMDINTDAGRQSLLNAISQPVVVPTGWAWDSATSTLSEGMDLGIEGAAPPVRTGMTAEQQSAITQALMMQDVARSVYDKAVSQDIGMQPVEAGIASQEGMQADQLASSERMATADLAMQKSIAEARESGELQRQRERIQAEATQQGRAIDDRQLDREAEEAIIAMKTGSAETIAQLQSTTQVGLEDRRVALEDRKIAAQTEQERLDRILDERELTLDEQQSLRNLRVQMRELDVAEERLAGEERMATERAGTATAQIGAEKSMAASQLSSQEGMQAAQIKADAEAQKQGILAGAASQQVAGEQQLAQIGATGQQQRETYESQLETQQRIAGEERAALAIATSPEGLAQAQTTATSYTTTLNTSLKNAADGDFSGVESALATPLPPTPPGIQWDAQSGGFIQSAGFEGREMDAATQQWKASVTPAFKARARAEQAVSQARTLEIERQTQQRAKQQADEDFREAMLTADIDTAEEAIARQKMAETAQIQNETKLQNMQMMFGLLQNPTQLYMARKHGLLGQIETALGFQMSGMPEVTTPGGVPNPNEWANMDNEEKQITVADYVDNGGSMDDFMMSIRSSAPAQMQATQYATL